MKRVIIASTNPVKINAVKTGFTQMFSEQHFEFSGIDVSSGVSDQPMGDEETLQGALNRAQIAQQHKPDADYFVGIEGGVDIVQGEMEVFAWIVILSTHESKIIGKSRTAVFYLPHSIAKLVENGMELGTAVDTVYGCHNSKQKQGSIGFLTGDVMDRTDYYVPSIILALIPFKNKELY